MWLSWQEEQYTRMQGITKLMNKHFQLDRRRRIGCLQEGQEQSSNLGDLISASRIMKRRKRMNRIIKRPNTSNASGE